MERALYEMEHGLDGSQRIDTDSFYFVHVLPAGRGHNLGWFTSITHPLIPSQEGILEPSGKIVY